MQDQILQLQKENAKIEEKIKEQYQTYITEREKLRARNKTLRYALYQEQAKNKAAVEQFSAKIASLEEKIASKQQYIRYNSPTQKPIFTSDRSARFKEIQERGRMLERKADEILMKCRSSDPRAFLYYGEQNYSKANYSPPDYKRIHSDASSRSSARRSHRKASSKSQSISKKSETKATKQEFSSSTKKKPIQHPIIIEEEEEEEEDAVFNIAKREEESSGEYLEPESENHQSSDKADEYSSITQPENDEDEDNQIPVKASASMKKSSSVSSNKSVGKKSTQSTKSVGKESKQSKSNATSPFDVSLSDNSEIGSQNKQSNKQQEQQSKEQSQKDDQNSDKTNQSQKENQNPSSTTESTNKLQKAPATMSSDDPFANISNLEQQLFPDKNSPQNNSPVATQQVSDIVSDPFNSTGGFTDFQQQIQSNSHLTDEVLPNPVPEPASTPPQQNQEQNNQDKKSNTSQNQPVHQDSDSDDPLNFSIPDFDFQDE